MKKRILNISLLSILLAVFVVFSCKKEKEEEVKPPQQQQTDITAAQDQAIAEGMFSDVFKQGTDGMRDGEHQVGHTKGELPDKANCPTVTITPFDTVNWPKTIYVDFGTTNCTCQDGRLRRGKVKIVATNWFRKPGAQFTITPEDYYVNEYKVAGQKVVTNQGVQNGYLTYTVVVQNAVITKPNNGGQILWSTNRTHQWIAGESTVLNIWDDEWKVTGTADGTASNGTTYTVSVTEPLYVATICRWIKKGKLDVNIQGWPTITVDYGDGTCDANATATINGYTFPFTMN